MVTLLKAPVILISGGSASSASVQAAATMVAGQGAIPIVLSNHLGRIGDKDRDGMYAEVKRMLQKADGLLVMGNNGDIDPSEYGQAKDAKTNSEIYKKDASGNEVVNPEGMARRNYEMALMRTAIEQGMPMVGICGGMQRMNVICSGTLHQHIPDQMRDVQHGEHAQQELGIPPFVPVQPVEISSGSTLGNIAESISTVFTPARTSGGNVSLDVNSMHHQAVAQTGSGLRVCACAEDILKDHTKLIEAIEIDPNGPLAKTPQGADRFGIFVQWHPEFSDSMLGARLTKNFTAAAVEYAKATGRSHTLEEVREENRISAEPTLKAPGPDNKIRMGSMTAMILAEREISRYDPTDLLPLQR